MVERKDLNLGDAIGFGSRTMVYVDASDPGFLIKETFPLPAAHRIEPLKLEVKLFNQYYGKDAAQFLGNNADNTVSYMRMPNIQGASLEDLMRNPAALPGNLDKRLLEMLAKLEKAGIAHNDLESRNILYDAATDTCYPVDFGSAKYVGADLAQSNDRNTLLSLLREINGNGESLAAMSEQLEALKA